MHFEGDFMKRSIALLGILALSSSVFAGGGSPSTDVKLAYDYDKIKVKSGVTLVDGNIYDVESIAVSNGGDKLCWIGKSKNKKWQYPIDIFVKNTSESSSERPRKLYKSRRLNAYTKCAFNNEDNVMTSELLYKPFAITATLYHSLVTGDFEPKRYHSYMSTYDYETNERLGLLTPIGIGHENNREFLKHPRMSPDNNWMVYYTMGNYGKKGIYLLNMKTQKRIHLGVHADKHPTWTMDGTKILFHTQVSDRKKGGLEQAYLGYYDMKFNGDNVTYKRVMLDDMSKKGYAYHKHPAVYPGTDLLFFHGQTKPEGKKKMFVRSFSQNSQIYEVKMYQDGMKIRKAKHPATGRSDSGLYYVGKKDIPGERYKIYRLGPNSINNLRNLVK